MTARSAQALLCRGLILSAVLTESTRPRASTWTPRRVPALPVLRRFCQNRPARSLAKASLP